MAKIKLSVQQSIVYLTLGTNPTMAEIAAETGLNERQIHTAIEGLRKKGVNIKTSCYKVVLVDPVKGVES